MINIADRKLNYNNFYNLVFGVFLFTELLIPHTLISQVVFVLFILFSLFVVLKSRKININILLFTHFLAIIYFALMVLFGYSISIQTTVNMLLTLIVNFIFLICFLQFIQKNQNGIETFNKIYVIVVSLVSMIVLLISIPSLIQGYRLGQGPNLLGIEFNANEIGMAAAIAVILNLVLKYKKMYKSTTGLYLLMIAFLSGSRKAIIIIIISLLVLIFYNRKRLNMKYIVLTMFGLILSILLVMNVPLLYEIVGSRVESLFSYLLNNSGDGSITIREKYIILGLEYFSNNPIFGYGLDNFRLIPGSYGTYSHNNFIEILFSGGLIFFFIYYSVLFYCFIKSIKAILKGEKNKSIYILIIFASLLISEIAMVTYFERQIIMFHMLALIGIKKNTKLLL